MFRSPGAIAFQLGPLEIRWYGILTAASIALGLWLADRQARAENLPAEEISRCAWWAVVTGYLGARLYEVAFNWDYYGRNPWKILAVWEGGLAIHGGFIVGGRVGAWLATRRGLPVLRSLDVAAPSLAIAQAIGRWGNFFNEEAFGRPTDLPWAVYISPSHRPPGYATAERFHPTFLYESLWDLGLFVLLVSWLRPRFRSRPGVLFFSYIGLYSVGRFAIEALRLDSFWVGEFRVAQLASLVGMAFAIRLGALGATVVVNYNTSAAAAAEVVAEIETGRGGALSVQGDVSRFETALEVVKAATAARGRLDILVNNAGTTRDGLLVSMKEAEFDFVIAQNLKSVFNCSKAAVRQMIKQRYGRIVNITSVIGMIGGAV